MCCDQSVPDLRLCRLSLIPLVVCGTLIATGSEYLGHTNIYKADAFSFVTIAV